MLTLQVAKMQRRCPMKKDTVQKRKALLRMLTTSNSSCVNENECLTGAHNCDPQATCTDTAGSFTCECSQQFPCEQDPCDGTVGQCVATCGDGVRGGNETCDDGNNDAGDGCENCVQMSGWNCSSTSKPEVCTNPLAYRSRLPKGLLLPDLAAAAAAAAASCSSGW